MVEPSDLLYLIEILHQTTTIYGNIFIRNLLYLIEILHQTTTSEDSPLFCYTLYLIEILHQTTTAGYSVTPVTALYLIEILHQTTTAASTLLTYFSCILSKFYIKPQHRYVLMPSPAVVSYRNSTSNHNLSSAALRSFTLYLIEILHQTTTAVESVQSHVRCILSKFYIKPQQGGNPTAWR